MDLSFLRMLLSILLQDILSHIISFFQDCCFPRIPTPALRAMRQVDACSDAAFGIEGFEGLTTVLALECCFSHFCEHRMFLLSLVIPSRGVCRRCG